eukprot:3390572-Amphidinium_carterae.2
MSALRHYGEKLVRVKTDKGIPLDIQIHVADVHRPSVSVKRLVEWGYTVALSPERGTIRAENGDEIPLKVKGGTYALPLMTNGVDQGTYMPGGAGEVWVAAGEIVVPDQATSSGFGDAIPASQEASAGESQKHGAYRNQNKSVMLRLWVVEWILRSLRSAGIQRFLLLTTIHSLIESLDQTATGTCRSAPRGSHSSIGAEERWHQDLKGQMKAMISELSAHVGGLDVEIGSPIRV